MERVMTVLTDEQQAFVGAVAISSMPTHRARLAGVMGVYLDGHRPMQEGFIGDHTMQFGKGPFGRGSVGLSLLLARLFAILASRALTDVCQVLQPDQRMGISSDDAFGDHMIGILLQPSLSPTNHDGSSCSRASAFLLQTLPQSRIMICFGNKTFARMKRLLSPGRSSDCQLTDTHINANDSGMLLWRGFGYFKFKGDQQIELLAWLVIPEFSSSNLCSLVKQGHMLTIARIGNDHPPVQGQDTHLVAWLQTIIPLVVVGERWGNIVRRAIKALVAFLGLPCLPCGSVLLELCPEGLIGGSNLAGNVGCHLRGQVIESTYL